MSAFKDLTGQRFGRLTVIERADDYISPSGNKAAQWQCRCDCGKYIKVRQNSLVTGNTRSCGCLSHETQTSFPEQALFFYVKKYFNDVINSCRDVIGKELDIYIPSIKVAIEYDGLKWHKDNYEIDLNKNKLCTQANITLIRVRELGLDDIQGSYNIITDDLKDSIIKVLLFLNINNQSIDVDIDRDRSLIYDSYIVNQKENSLLTLFPDIYDEWDYDKNGTLTPDKVSYSSTKIIWWKCNKNHSYSMNIDAKIRNGIKCPICSNHRLLKGYNDFQTLYPDIAQTFADDLNNGLHADDFIGSSSKQVWWRCDKGHIWKTSINARCNMNSGCPICANKQVLRGYNDLATLCPDLLNEWDYNLNEILPNDVTKYSHKKVHWICSNGHKWVASIKSRTLNKSGCPKCNLGGNFKKVICVETNTIFENMILAAKFANLNTTSGISACCKNRQKTAGGYHWKYYDE